MGAYPVRYDRIGFLRTQDSLILFEISFLGEILAFVMSTLFRNVPLFNSIEMSPPSLIGFMPWF
jgi:hypothetical protein